MAVAIAIALPLASAALPAAEKGPASIRESLTFHASFDNGPDADFAKGDRAVYTASTNKRDDAKPGLPPNVVIAEGAGRKGDALRFVGKNDRVVFYRVDRNLPYRASDWSGTLSFWIRVDPETELAPDYTDPLQVTERAWNDAALWVDFSKDDSPRHFRLGAFADLKVWNPTNKDFEKMTPAERPMHDAGKPPFGSDKWSHVAITFERFNTGRADGEATLYLDGKKHGSITGRKQVFTWDPEKAAIMIGLSYTGLLDELAIFDRALTPDEIATLHAEGL